MAAPVDIPSNNVVASENPLLTKSPVVSYNTINKFKNEDESGVPLQTPWTLWLDKTTPAMTASQYEHNLRKIYTFNTIQGFWAVFNNVPNVVDVPLRFSYHLMRDERRPVWEEPYNQGGGAWRFRCHKKDTPQVWRELLLASIGEQLTDSLAPGDDVVGLTVSIRDRFDVVQVWNQNARLANNSTLIEKVERLLSDVVFQEPLYKPHETHYAFENTSR